MGAENYRQLEAGYEFPPGNFKLDASRVALFLEAVEDTSYPYRDTQLIPPMAVAALAMASLSNTISLPPGTIHVSQELGFVAAVSLDDSLASYARISRAQKRDKLHLIIVDIDVRNQHQQTVLTSKIGFILPLADGEK